MYGKMIKFEKISKKYFLIEFESRLFSQEVNRYTFFKATFRKNLTLYYIILV